MGLTVAQVSAAPADAQVKKIEDEIVFRASGIILSLATSSLERYTLVTMEYLSEHALQYKGSDWAAMVFTFLSLYLLGNKSRTGFVMGIIANVFWFSYGYLTGSVANMFCSSVVIYLQARGWVNWGKDTDLLPASANSTNSESQ